MGLELGPLEERRHGAEQVQRQAEKELEAATGELREIEKGRSELRQREEELAQLESEEVGTDGISCSRGGGG